MGDAVGTVLLLPLVVEFAAGLDLLPRVPHSTSRQTSRLERAIEL